MTSTLLCIMFSAFLIYSITILISTWTNEFYDIMTLQNTKMVKKIQLVLLSQVIFNSKYLQIKSCSACVLDYHTEEIVWCFSPLWETREKRKNEINLTLKSKRRLHIARGSDIEGVIRRFNRTGWFSLQPIWSNAIFSKQWSVHLN